MPCSRSRGGGLQATPKGEVEGDLVQVHSQGVKLMGIWSRPTAKGEVEGDLAGVGGGACSQGVPGLGDAWSRGVCLVLGGGCLVETPRGLLLRAVHILLECILFHDKIYF